MKLFLHAGTEKTGSSHIQTLCVNGREHLQAAGIWFPEGIPRHERRMRAGLVSAGNAFVISERAREGDHADVLAELVRHREAGQSGNCRAVFLTSELLLPYCANPGTWQKLFENCRQAGFDSVSVLMVLRNPVEQLISLYKHRARSGRAGRMDEWVEDGYHLPRDLEQLRKQADVEGIELTARGYTRRPGGLEDLFFRDWLNMQAPPPTIDGEVNPSLSLSELELVRHMNMRRPELVPFLHEHLSALPRTCKVQGSTLEAHARAVVETAVWQHREEWQRWNELLPECEHLTLPENPPEIPERPEELGFSDRQVEALAGFLAEAARPGFVARVWWRGWLRPGLGKLRSKFQGKG